MQTMYIEYASKNAGMNLCTRATDVSVPAVPEHSKIGVSAPHGVWAHNRLRGECAPPWREAACITP